MKWFNFETMFISLATKVGDFMHNNAIYFETSKNGRYYHFEIYTDIEGAKKINDFINGYKIIEEV